MRKQQSTGSMNRIAEIAISVLSPIDFREKEGLTRRLKNPIVHQLAQVGRLGKRIGFADLRHIISLCERLLTDNLQQRRKLAQSQPIAIECAANVTRPICFQVLSTKALVFCLLNSLLAGGPRLCTEQL